MKLPWDQKWFVGMAQLAVYPLSLLGAAALWYVLFGREVSNRAAAYSLVIAAVCFLMAYEIIQKTKYK